MRLHRRHTIRTTPQRFPFLLGGAFIEAPESTQAHRISSGFPFLLGGAFIEARSEAWNAPTISGFPFLLGGAFIEATDGLLFTEDHAEISLPSWRGFH